MNYITERILAGSARLFSRHNSSVYLLRTTNWQKLTFLRSHATAVDADALVDDSSLSNVRPDYARRRQRLMTNLASEHLKNASSNHLVLIPASTQTYSTVDVPHRFRQNTDFLYLTGISLPDCVLAIHCKPTSSGSSPSDCIHSTLFMPVQSAVEKLWMGATQDDCSVKSLSGVDVVENLAGLESWLGSMRLEMAGPSSLLWFNGADHTHAGMVRRGFYDLLPALSVEWNASSVGSPDKFIHELRWKKDDWEIGRLRQSCRMISEALAETIPYSAVHPKENVLAAKLQLEVQIAGADCFAFPPVIAGGNRANTIHHLEGTYDITLTDMILMDCGCELDGYVSDMTRCWPASGRFSDAGSPARELYEALLGVQATLIELAATQRPVSISDLHYCMYLLLGEALQKFGIVNPSLEKFDAAREAERFCPHMVGHYLGMDCHDTSLISKAHPLEPGVVITIEPGIYLPESNLEIPKEFRGIGYRIEDDILLTESGVEVLTCCPKGVEEVEALFVAKSK